MTFVHRSRCHDKSRVSIVSNPFKDVRLVDDGLTRPTSRANFSWTRRSRVSAISKVLVVVHPRLDGFCRVRKRSSQEGKLCSFKYFTRFQLIRKFGSIEVLTTHLFAPSSNYSKKSLEMVKFFVGREKLYKIIKKRFWFSIFKTVGMG